MKKAWIVQGGWDGHEPKLTSKRFAGLLEKNGYEATIFDSLDCLGDLEALMQVDLLVACWTMGEIKREYTVNVPRPWARAWAWRAATAACAMHSARIPSGSSSPAGEWVSHPGGDGVEYMVNICKGSSPIVEGLEDFPVCSEHYYLHVDPAIEVLATTRFPSVTYYHISNKPVDMPVAWTKFWGNGRVFYTSLGHHDDVFDKSPTAQVLMERGMLWAGEGKQYAIDHGLSTERFENQAKMY